MTKAYYSVIKIGKLVLVRHYGDWTLAKDIEYLNVLNDMMLSMRPHHFAVFVDMRAWVVPDSVKYTTIKANLHMDRRGQLAECWLCDTLEMSDYLLPYFENTRFNLTRLTDFAEAKAWALAYASSAEHKNQVEQWFDDKH